MLSNKRLIPVLIILLIAVNFVILLRINNGSAVGSSDDNYNSIVLYKALNEVIKKTRSVYYKDVETNKMLEGAIKGALASLDDPYSFYLSPTELKREAENLYNAKFGGLGIRIYEDSGLVKIARPLPNTPAMKAGLHSGDYIVAVDGERIRIGGIDGISLNDAVDKLRGDPKTPVTVTIRRRGRQDEFDVTLERDIIKIDSVEKTIIDSNIGYIRINSFTGRTTEEFRNALLELQTKRELDAIILDLRRNPGGLLDAAKGVADAFISDGIIVSTKGKLKDFNKEYKASKEILCPNSVDVIVLVDEYSASGSEIVAGAIKDTNRGILVGTETFGKGVVQQRFPLDNNVGAVSLTIATYYTPNGTSIHGNGIEPNVVQKYREFSIEEQLMIEKMREAKLVDKYVLDYIKNVEASTGKTPQNFDKLEAKLPELISILKENQIHLDETLVKLEARNIFDANVGIDRVVDLENDEQLKKALEVIKADQVSQIIAESKKQGNIDRNELH